MMLVVGPKGIASVEEAMLIDGVKVICAQHNIENDLRELIYNPQQLLYRATRTNAFAKKKFPIEVVRKKLYDDFFKLIIK